MPRAATAATLVLIAVAGCGGDTSDAAPRVESLAIRSTAVDRTMQVDVVLPAGDPKGRPLLVFLHGRGADEGTYVRRPFLDALERLGDRAPVVAFPDGAKDEYWHDRASGRWGGYVLDEVLPQVRKRFHTSRKRVAIGGISMGGFGAYDLARLRPQRFCAVGGHSPALWQSAGETAAGAFDDAEDFARHDVVAAAGALRGLPVWLDAGDRDPFRPGVDAFAGALRAAGADATVHTWSGGHDSRYWNAHWGAYLRFYARELDRC